MRPKAAKYYKLQHSWIGRLILYSLVLPIEIHLTLCELYAMRRSTLAGLLLQNCLIVVSLLARWCDEQRHSIVRRQVQQSMRFLKTRIINSTIVCSNMAKHNLHYSLIP